MCLLLRYLATSNKDSYFYWCVRVSKFLRFNSSRMGETRHIAPSLRRFHPELPNSVSPFLSSVGCACNVTLLWSVSSFFLRFSFFRGDHSPTVTSAPSLRPARLERFPDNLQSVRFFIFIQGCLTQSISVTHGVAGAPTYPAPTPCAISSFVLERVDPSTRSIPSFFVIRWEFRLFVSRVSL
jgi:hypothetical protein